MRILVVNAGSSSLKLSLLDGNDDRLWSGDEVEASDVVSDEDKGALDMAAIRFGGCHVYRVAGPPPTPKEPHPRLRARPLAARSRRKGLFSCEVSA